MTNLRSKSDILGKLGLKPVAAQAQMVKEAAL